MNFLNAFKKTAASRMAKELAKKISSGATPKSLSPRFPLRTDINEIQTDYKHLLKLRRERKKPVRYYGYTTTRDSDPLYQSALLQYEKMFSNPKMKYVGERALLRKNPKRKIT